MKNINIMNIQQIKQQINEIYESHEQVLYKLQQKEMIKFFYQLHEYEQEKCFMIDDTEIIDEISKFIVSTIENQTQSKDVNLVNLDLGILSKQFYQKEYQLLIESMKIQLLKQSNMQNSQLVLKFKVENKEHWFRNAVYIYNNFCSGSKDLIDVKGYSDFFYSYFNQFFSNFEYKQSDYKKKLKKIVEIVVILIENNILQNYYLKQKMENSRIRPLSELKIIDDMRNQVTIQAEEEQFTLCF